MKRIALYFMSTEIMRTASEQFLFVLLISISEMADMRGLIAWKCVHELSTTMTLLANYINEVLYKITMTVMS